MKSLDLGRTRILVPHWAPSCFGHRTIRKEFRSYVFELLGLKRQRNLVGQLFDVTDGEATSQNFVVGAWRDTTRLWKLWFHKDCDGASRYVIVWSNHTPTLVRYATSKKRVLAQAQDGSILLLENRIVEHAAPMYVGERWFARIIIK